MTDRQTTPSVHTRPMRAVSALRALVLVVLAGVILGMALTYGRRDRPQTEITMTVPPAGIAGQGPILDQADRFEINGTREGRPAFALLAHTVAGFAGERKLLEQVDLTIHEDEGGSVRIVGRQGQFDPAARQAQLSGGVTVETPDGLSLSTGTLYYDSDRDVIFTADDIRFSVGGLEGSGRGLNYLVADRQLKIPDDVNLRIRDEGDGVPATIRAGDLVASLVDNTAVFTDGVRLERGGDVLSGHYLKLQLDPGRKHVTALRSFGDVVATLPPAGGGEASELRADSLTATIAAPSDTLDRAEASGGCVIISGPYTSRSRTVLFLREEDRIELRGDPVVETYPRDRIAAQEIDLHPGAQALEARGDVRTVSLPEPRSAGATPGFGAGGAVSFQSSELRADQALGRAVYSGSARAWQEGNSLQADEIVIDHAARRLHASGKVMSRWTTAGAARPGTAPARPLVTVITSDRVTLDGDGGTGRYESNVRLTRTDASLTADLMEAHLAESAGRRELVRIVATGSVAAKRQDSYGTARSAEFLSRESLLILRDEEGLAEVVDAATGRSMRGRTLTYDLAADRILTESAHGDRTWITLAPESKDAPAVEPKTRR